jgi:hypothetical protein
MKILFKYPTRQRPEWFKKTLTAWQSMLSGEHDFAFVISCDIDDETMNNIEMMKFMDSFNNVQYRFGSNKTKIDACNADMDVCTNWDIVVLVSDDMVPQVDGYDAIIVNDMVRHFPDLDGALHYPDGCHGGKSLITLSIMGKKLYDSFGYIYYPGYKSFFCDTEFTNIVYKIGKCVFIDDVIVKHEWRKHNDLLYATNQAAWGHDEQLHKTRSRKIAAMTSVRDRIEYGIPPSRSFTERGGKCIDIDVSRANLLDCKECCDEAGLKFWLSFGTLLGAVREENFIAHDHDTDVGIFKEDFDPLCLALEKLESRGFEIVRTQIDLLVTVMRDGEYIDFYRFKDDGNSRHCNGVYIENHRLAETEKIMFLGEKFDVPKEPKKLLLKQYGDTWRTPIKGKVAKAG